MPCHLESFFLINTGKVNKAIVISINGTSNIKEELTPKSLLPMGTSNGANVTEIPETSTKLKTFAPITFPIP